MTTQVDYKKSVKKADWVEGSGLYQFVVPAFGWDGARNRSIVLPHDLPAYSRYSFYSNREWTLLQTTEHEGQWANTVAIATSRAMVWGWEVQSAIPLRRKRSQRLFNTSSAGTFVGWVPFSSAHIRSFLLLGRAHVEIERERKGAGSRIIGLHHLNPLRCRLTDSPKYPLEYLDRHGKIHKLAHWQVMNFADQLDPSEGEMKWVEGSAERAYKRIVLTESVMRFLMEKITGSRALSIEFIQGITRNALQDALQSGEHDQARHGAMLYKGVVAIPIPGDVPVQRVTIPLAEIPDGFDAQSMRDDATIVYAGATGLDVNDIDPRLATRATLGSGAQSVVLDQKTKGKGLVAWKKAWQTAVNEWVLDTATKFTWSDTDLVDEKARADINSTRANTAKTLTESQIITPEQAKNVLVDKGDLPREFLENDQTPTVVLGGDDKPTEEATVKEVDIDKLLADGIKKGEEWYENRRHNGQ